MQIEPIQYGMLQLNINIDVFAGESLKEANEMFHKSSPKIDGAECIAEVEVLLMTSH